MKLSYTIDINSTPAKVFSLISEPDRAMSLASGVKEYEILHKTENKVGTKFREIIEEDGHQVELTGYINKYELNKLIALHLESKYNSVDTVFELEDIAALTRVTQNVDTRFKNFTKIIAFIMGRKIKKNILLQLQRDLTKLKEFCENDISK